MGVLGPALSADSSVQRALDDRYYPGVAATSDVTVDADGAMTIPAVYACVALIGEDLGKSPTTMFEDLGEQGHRPAPNHPIDELLHFQPNAYQTALEFKEMLTAFALLRGVGVAEIHTGARGPVDALEPLHPDLIREETSSSGKRRYKYRDPRNGFEERTLLSEEVFVLRGRLGRSVIEFGRTSLGLELAMERYAAFMFSRGAKHQGVIKSPKLLGTPVKDALRQAIDEYAIDGPRAGRPLLLEDGMEWQDISIAPRDTEFLAQRRFGIEQVCRLFRVPPHKIAALERSTNNNIEQQSIDYVTDTLLGWAIRWELAIRRDLVVARGRYFAKFNLDALMRGDPTARAEAYAMAVQWGWMTRNEVRRKEDMNPLPGLDAPLTPLNMTGGQEPAPAPARRTPRAISAEARGHLRLFASDAASRVVRREVAAMTKLAERTAGDPKGWAAGVAEFYATHPDHVREALHVPHAEALRYAREQSAALLERGPVAMADWPVESVSALTDLALNREELAA